MNKNKSGSKIWSWVIFSAMMFVIVIIGISVFTVKNDDGDIIEQKTTAVQKKEAMGRDRAEKIIREYADKNGIDFNDYPASIVDLFARNSETEDFVLSYPKEKDKSHKINMKEYKNFRFEGYVYKKMKLTENGVAYLFVTKKMKKKFGLSNEDASASVSYMDSIKNSLVWVAFIEGDDGKIRVRLRSRFLPISDIAERYRGGGHACAAGATLYSKAEIKLLLKEADEKLKEYKQTHEGWL